jgi:hypothetical protein
MYIQAINRGFVVMTSQFNYVVEAMFISDVVDIYFKGEVVTFASPREILLHDDLALLSWIKQRVIEMCSNELRDALSI